MSNDDEKWERIEAIGSRMVKFFFIAFVVMWLFLQGLHIYHCGLFTSNCEILN